ncbi:MAG: hypothetical protein O2827_04535 [Verrucomicrobia bacterium]|nr:hypothetical protein [Verrucomicrobiota bacterium]
MCIACSKPADIVVNNGGDTVSPDYIPNPPSELTGEINGNKILLSWKDNSTGESGFVLSRKEHTRPFVQIAELESNVINFVDEPDSLSINYFYTVFKPLELQTPLQK